MNDQRSTAEDDWCRRCVGELLRAQGLRKTAGVLGLHPQTILGIAAGTRVMPGSMALARERLRGLEEARDEGSE